MTGLISFARILWSASRAADEQNTTHNCSTSAQTSPWKNFTHWSNMANPDTHIDRSIAALADKIDRVVRIEDRTAFPTIAAIQQQRRLVSQDNELGPDPELDFDAGHNLQISNVHHLEVLERLKEELDINWETERENVLAEQRSRVGYMQQLGIANDTIEMYMLLERRPFERLFPENWPRGDTPFFEHNMHAGYDAIIRGQHDIDGRAEYAFRELMKMAMRARCIRTGPSTSRRRTETVLANSIHQYLRWTYRDIRVENLIWAEKLVPLISVVAGSKHMKTDRLERKTLNTLKRKAEKLLAILKLPDADPSMLHDERSYIIPPPTLWALAIYREVIAVVAYQPLSGSQKLITIGFYHFRNALYNEWNTVAIALVAIFCREQLYRMKGALELRDEEFKRPRNEEDE